jgi:ABC-type proline/glycine betaine transport system substrate-binding protein
MMMKQLVLTAFAAFIAVGAPTLAADKGRVELAYVEWSSEVASTNHARLWMTENPDRVAAWKRGIEND